MYTITFACGHTEDVTTKGYLEPSTVRFLANSKCSVCSEQYRYSTLSPYRTDGYRMQYHDLQWAKRDAADWINAGLTRVIVQDHQLNQDVIITASGIERRDRITA